MKEDEVMMNVIKNYFKKVRSELEVNHSYVHSIVRETRKIYYGAIILIGLVNLYSYIFTKIEYGLISIRVFDFLLAYLIFVVTIGVIIYLIIYFIGLIYHTLFRLMFMYLLTIFIIFAILSIGGIFTYLMHLWYFTAPAQYEGSVSQYLGLSLEILTAFVLFVTLIYTVHLNNKTMHNSIEELQEKYRYDSLPLIKAYPVLSKRDLKSSRRFNESFVHPRTYLYGEEDAVKIYPLIIKNIGHTPIYSLGISSCTFRCEPNHTDNSSPELLVTKYKGENETPLAIDDKLSIGFGIDLDKVRKLITEEDEFGRLVFTLDIHLMDTNRNRYEEILTLGFYYQMHKGELEIIGDYINIFNNTKLISK